MFKKDSDCLGKLKEFSDKIIDFSSFMVNVLNVSSEEFKTTHKKVAYHAPCHLCRGLDVTTEPRKLIQLAGYTYVRSKDEDVCCGFGGSYSIDFPEISAEILKKKLDNVEDTPAEFLVTDCPGCVLQLRGGMDKRRGKIQVKHIAELLAESVTMLKRS
jgi:Fe-S oxidoreductase